MEISNISFVRTQSCARCGEQVEGESQISETLKECNDGRYVHRNVCVKATDVINAKLAVIRGGK